MGAITLTSRPSSDVSETTQKAQALIDPKVGIIRTVREIPKDPTDPRLFHMGALAANTTRFTGMECSRINGGASLVRNRAIAAAIGEVVERYCSGIYDEESLVQAPYREVKTDAIDPRTFPLGSEMEYRQADCPLNSFSEDVPIYWVRGYALGQEQHILVPASMVFLPYRYVSPGEYIFQAFSTGLACGNTREEAILSAMYEVIERDAFTITWLNRLSVPTLDVSGARMGTVPRLLYEYDRCRAEVYIRDITTDIGIPTILTMIREEHGRGPALVIATATRLEPEQALIKSLEELAMTRLYAKRLMKEHPDFHWAEDFRDINELDQHVLLYTRPEMLSTTKFLMSPVSEHSLEDIPDHSPVDVAEKIRTCLRCLQGRGLDAIVVDLTTPDVADVGLSVARVLIPGMQPLNADHRMRYLGGTRLYQVPRILGYTDRNTTEAQLNPYPHPFP